MGQRDQHRHDQSKKDYSRHDQFWHGRRDQDKAQRMSEREFEYTEYRRDRDDDTPRHNFNADDQERVIDDARYREGSDYGTNIGRSVGESKIFDHGWNEDAQGYGDRTRRHLSAGSERPFSSQHNNGRDLQPFERRSHEMNFGGRGPKGYKRSDERLKEEVCDRLTDHSFLDASEIEVNVEGGHVTLTGTVDSRRTKRMAEDALEGIRGISDISNQIKIHLPSDPGMNV